MPGQRILAAAAMIVLGAGACSPPTTPPVTPPAAATPAAPVQRSNPASENCAQQGGRLVIERESGGGEIGVCLFEDNRQCEEWALLRGDCPKGGIRVAGYETTEERHRAIRGEK